ncbi:hypothetical protein K438DRAFT_1974584 [Mycena galopus ATCC 62051]|nr:hypothetical protein K438DRAFT_1974584 [Mycena galopus ATCC 62051]
MLSHSNHDVQNGAAAPLTYLAPQLHHLPQSDPLSTFHSRLEASLDSALATLTLIRDYTQTGPMLTVRAATVLQALCKHASEPQPVLPHITTPIPTPLASSSPTPTSMSATYAETVTRSAPDPVVTATTRAASDPVVTVAADKPMLTPVTAAPTHPVKAHNTPDLVFHFNELRKLHGVRVATLQSPALLFSSINNKDTIGDLKLASIRWTPRGNLTLAFTHDEQFIMAEAWKRAPHIWNHLSGTLGLPGDCPPITAQKGTAWHKVVIHNVPVTHDGTPITSSVTPWLQRCGVPSVIKAVSFMCNEEELATRSSAPLHVSLALYKDAETLLHNGALMLGSHCRVSQYIPKTKSKPTASPPP